MLRYYGSLSFFIDMKIRSKLIAKFCPLPILFMIVAVLFAGGLTSGTCGAAGESTEIRVGSELDFPPYAFVDESGRPAGFSVELIKAIADVMGLSIKISTGPWDTVWNALVNRQLDLLPIVAKLPERQPLVDFSLPHTETFDAFFVRKGTPPIQNIESAKGKEIVVMRSDAAHHALLERNFQGHVILVSTIPEGLSLVSSGKHDALLCSKLIGTMVINQNRLKGLAAGPLLPDYKRLFSFAVKKGDTELLEKLNQGLLIIKTSGQYNRIYEKWLTADDPWKKWEKYLLPGIVTLAVIALIGGFWLLTLQLLVKKRTRELAERNEMLRLAREDLEEKVAERTANLQSANLKLQVEITERKRAEDALVAANERASSLARFPEENPQPVMRVASDGVILYCNPATKELAGWGCEVGEMLAHPLLKVFGKAMVSGAETQEDIEWGGKVYAVWIMPVLEEGYANIYGRDITKRKQAEELLKKAHEELEIRVRERTEELANSQERLKNLASQLLLAQETERKRVAVEVHDGLLSELAAVKMLFEGKLKLLKQGRLSDLSEFQKVSDILTMVMKEARGIMNNLHPSVLDELGLITAMSWLSGEYQKSYPHIRVEMKTGVTEGDISESIRVVIYRVLQEALNNFARHGKGDRVQLSLSKSDRTLEFMIRDNGQGFDVQTAQRGLGLESMRERVELSGGEFQIESVVGQGTTIRAIWKLSEPLAKS